MHIESERAGSVASRRRVLPRGIYKRADSPHLCVTYSFAGRKYNESCGSTKVRAAEAAEQAVGEDRANEADRPGSGACCVRRPSPKTGSSHFSVNTAT